MSLPRQCQLPPKPKLPQRNLRQSLQPLKPPALQSSLLPLQSRKPVPPHLRPPLSPRRLPIQRRWRPSLSRPLWQ